MVSREALQHPFADPDLPTLADVLSRIDGAESQTAAQKSDLRSAVRTVARVLGRPASELSAHPQFLRKRLAAVEPVRHGLKPARWRNVRSLFGKALGIAGVKVLPGRYLAPLTPEWRCLRERLPAKPHAAGLSRFMAFCSVRHIAPEDVDDEVFADYLTALEQESLIRRPRDSHRDACRCWNLSVDEIPDWPAVRVRVPCYKQAYSLPWTAFPGSLEADVDAYFTQAMGSDLLANHHRRPIRETSAKSEKYLLRNFASAVTLMGSEPETLQSLTDLVQVETVKAGLRFHLNRNNGVSSPHIHQTAKVLTCIATHWVKVASDHLDQLKTLRRSLDPGRHGMTSKNRDTLREFESLDMQRKLVVLPEEVFKDLRKLKEPKVTKCVEAQVALAIAILLRAPLRIKNLAALEIGRHLIPVRGDESQLWHIHVPNPETKTGEEIEYPLPLEVSNLLDEYLESYRSRLVHQPNDYLFPGGTRSHKGSSLLSNQIADMVGRQIGVRVTAHQFRHLAGFIYLQFNPGGHEVVRRLLGHKSINTTLQFYAGMEVSRAIRHYDEAILKLQKDGES